MIGIGYPQEYKTHKITQKEAFTPPFLLKNVNISTMCHVSQKHS